MLSEVPTDMAKNEKILNSLMEFGLEENESKV